MRDHCIMFKQKKMSVYVCVCVGWGGGSLPINDPASSERMFLYT